MRQLIEGINPEENNETMSYRGCRAVYTIQEENVPNP
jgi:hypothetical protein